MHLFMDFFIPESFFLSKNFIACCFLHYFSAYFYLSYINFNFSFTFTLIKCKILLYTESLSYALNLILILSYLLIYFPIKILNAMSISEEKIYNENYQSSSIISYSVQFYSWSLHNLLKLKNISSASQVFKSKCISFRIETFLAEYRCEQFLVTYSSSATP